MAVPKTKIKVLRLHHDFKEPAVDVAILEAIHVHVCDMKITNHPRTIRRRWMKQPAAGERYGMPFQVVTIPRNGPELNTIPRNGQLVPRL